MSRSLTGEQFRFVTGLAAGLRGTYLPVASSKMGRPAENGMQRSFSGALFCTIFVVMYILDRLSVVEVREDVEIYGSQKSRSLV